MALQFLVAVILVPLSLARQPLNQDAQPLNQDAQPLNQDAQPLSQDAQPDWAEQLRRFVLDAGGKADVHVIKDAAGGAGHGLAASRNAKKGEDLVLVPYKRTLSWDTLSKRAKEAVVAVVKEHYGVQEGDEDYDLAVRDTGIIAALVHERLRERLGADSKTPWSPYLQSLPKQAPPNWPSWPEEWRKGVDTLTNGELRSHVDGKMKLARRLAQFYAENSKAEELPEDVLMDVVGLVLSREILERLVPLLDLANHAFEPGTSFGCDNRKKMCYLRLDKDVKMGDEVRVDYGGRGNAQLLGIYGFKMDSNPYTTAAVPWPGAAGVPKSCESLSPRFALRSDKANALPDIATPCLATAFVNKFNYEHGKAWHNAELYGLGGCLTLQKEFAKTENGVVMKALTDKAKVKGADPTLKALAAATKKDVSTVEKCIRVMNASTAKGATKKAEL